MLKFDLVLAAQVHRQGPLIQKPQGTIITLERSVGVAVRLFYMRPHSLVSEAEERTSFCLAEIWLTVIVRVVLVVLVCQKLIVSIK